MSSTTTPHHRAQQALALLKQAVLGHLTTHPQGVTNAELADALGLRSDHGGRQRDYLTYSVLGLLLREGAVDSAREGNRRVYRITATKP